MLDIRCKEHLDAVRAFADTLGEKARASLDQRISRYKDDDNKKVVIMSERMSPHSFYIEVYRMAHDSEWKFWYNGGIIYHKHSKEWCIHT